MIPLFRLTALILVLASIVLPAAAQSQLFPVEVYDYDVAPNTTVKLTTVKWKPESSDEVTIEEKDGKKVTLINGRRAYGNNNGLLYELLSTGTVIFQGDEIPLETTFMFNPRLGAVYEIPLKARQSKSAFYLIGTFGYGDAVYYAVWRIRYGKSERVLLTDDASELRQYQ